MLESREEGLKRSGEQNKSMKWFLQEENNQKTTGDR